MTLIYTMSLWTTFGNVILKISKVWTGRLRNLGNTDRVTWKPRKYGHPGKSPKYGQEILEFFRNYRHFRNIRSTNILKIPEIRTSRKYQNYGQDVFGNSWNTFFFLEMLELRAFPVAKYTIDSPTNHNNGSLPRNVRCVWKRFTGFM